MLALSEDWVLACSVRLNDMSDSIKIDEWRVLREQGEDADQAPWRYYIGPDSLGRTSAELEAQAQPRSLRSALWYLARKTRPNCSAESNQAPSRLHWLSLPPPPRLNTNVNH